MSANNSFDRMPQPCIPIELDYTPVPEEVCCGVWVDDGHGFTPVTPQEVKVSDVPDGLMMYEYTDRDGNVRANLLSVPPAEDSPTWHIMPHAAEGAYYERHATVAGSGSLDIWFYGNNWVSIGKQHLLPEQPQIARTLIVKESDTFQLRAHQTGLHVLALFLGAPFKDEYEERVDTPFAQIKTPV